MLEADEDDDNIRCCCKCCTGCCCCGCQFTRDQARAMQWQVADVSLSALLIGECGYFIYWYVERALWVYFSGAVVLAAASIGAITTSVMGIACKNRFAAFWGGIAWILGTVVGACIIIAAGPLGCELKKCHAQPYYCSYPEAPTSQSTVVAESIRKATSSWFYYDGWYDDYWYNDYWYDDYWYNDRWFDDNYYYAEEYHRYASFDSMSAQDDFFKDMCGTRYCLYWEDPYHDDDSNGHYCLSEGYQHCGAMFGSRFEVSFQRGDKHWHGFDHRQRCDTFFLPHILLAKLPLLASVLVVCGVRLGMMVSTRQAMLNKTRRNQVSQVMRIIQDAQPRPAPAPQDFSDNFQYQLLAGETVSGGAAATASNGFC